MSTYSADKYQHFDDFPDLDADLANYDPSRYVNRRSSRSVRHRSIRDVRPGSGRGPSRGGIDKKKVVIIVLVIILLLVVYGIAFALSAKEAKSDASTLMTQGKNLVTQLKNGDNASAAQTVEDFSATAKKLNDNVGSPLWAVATVFPIYGGDVRDVRTLASVADVLSEEVLKPAVATIPEGGLKGILYDDGINVQALTNMLSTIGNAQTTIDSCASKVETLSEPNLDQLKEPVSAVKTAVETLATVSQCSSELARVLPGMLGADGMPSVYLITAANNAEFRPRGGMPGSFGLMTVNNGKINIGAFSGYKSEMSVVQGDTVLPLTNEEFVIFGERIGRDIRDASYDPSFPRAAELEKAFWERSGGETVDGVIQVDPVFLQKLLALTGASVTISDGTVIDGNNAAQELLNGVYFRYPNNNAGQDAFFAEVASSISSAVFHNLSKVDFVKFVDTMSNAIKDHHFMMWSSVPEEEALLIEFGLAGVVPSSEENPETGVYVAAAYPTKSCWYIDMDAEISDPHGNSDGTASYDVTVTLTNTLSDEEANIFNSAYQTVGVPQMRSSYDVLLDVYLFAPLGGTITNVTTDGYFLPANCFGSSWHTEPGVDPMTKTSYGSNEVWYGVTGITSKASTVIEYTVTTSAKAETGLEVDMTPLANESLK